MKLQLFLMLIGFVFSLPVFAAKKPIVVGSKNFTEGFLMAELAAQQLESNGFTVERRFGLGSTGVVSEAIAKGNIDIYPEYTGTIAQTLLGTAVVDRESLIQKLGARGLSISKPLGFANTYGLAVTEAYGEKHHLRTISDLRSVQGSIRTAFSSEFTSRRDGLKPLLEAYGLDFSGNQESIEHSLAYEAIASGRVDLIDVYSTDSQVKRLKLRYLKDDRGFFPNYDALFIARTEIVNKYPAAWAALNQLAGTLTQEKVMDLNGNVEMKKQSFSDVISDYLGRERKAIGRGNSDLIQKVLLRTREHAFLVGVTVLLAVITGVPLGILAVRRERIGQLLLLTSAVVQTIPSLALLCLLIPFFGIGTKPALVALYLYSLLPILLNTYIGLRSIDGRLLETAFALGLNLPQRIFWVELPLASRSILGGIKTATVIGIGTATLAALIGAGGYGAPIVSGLAINDIPTILSGAIPAAGMSLLVYLCFEILERTIIPKGLR